MTRLIQLTSCFASIFVLVGCVIASKPLEIGKDTYSVSATADGYRTAASARQSAFEIGRKLCASKEKRFMLKNESMRATRMGIDTTVDIIFRCLKEDDPEYVRPDMQQTPDVVIEDRRN